MIAPSGYLKKVLVTGANGFIGRHVADFGLQRGIEVIPTDIVGDQSGGTLRTLDISDATAVRHLLSETRPTAIIHLAAQGVYPGDAISAIIRTNIIGTSNIFEAIKALSLPVAVVVAGSCFEYGDCAGRIRESDPQIPISPYGVSKVASSSLARLCSSSIPVTLLRPFGVYGPREGSTRLLPAIVRSALAGERVRLTPGAQMRDFTFVGDMAEAFWRALQITTQPGHYQELNAGSGAEVSVREFATLVASELDRRNIGSELDFGAIPYRPNEAMRYVPDISGMERALGWKPGTSLATGIQITIAELLGDSDWERQA